MRDERGGRRDVLMMEERKTETWDWVRIMAGDG
jgi:hypothetical protein